MAGGAGRMVAAGLALVALVAAAVTARAETTLEKIGRTGTFVVGTRTGSPPFGFVDKQNNWGGFSVDMHWRISRGCHFAKRLHAGDSDATVRRRGSAVPSRRSSTLAPPP